MMKVLLYVFLLAGCIASAQQNTRKPKAKKTSTELPVKLLNISAKGDIITVSDKGKVYQFNFLMPKTIAVSSRFVKATNEFFYVRYDYTASARAQSYYMVGYRYYNGKVYMRRFANLKNRVGKWSGTTHFYQDKAVTKWSTVQELLTTKGAEDPSDSKSIGIYVDRKPKGKMALVNGIRGEAMLQRDEQFIGLLNKALTRTGGS